MFSGLRKIGATWRQERRLVCPWPAPTTWYGRAAAAVLVGSAAVTGLVGLTGATLVAGTGLGHVARRAEGWIDNAKGSMEPAFNDVPSRHWHDTWHLSRAASCLAFTGVVFSGVRRFNRMARCATNLCTQGALSALAATTLGVASAGALCAADNAHAVYLKQTHARDALRARKEHQQSFLRRHAPLRILLN